MNFRSLVISCCLGLLCRLPPFAIFVPMIHPSSQPSTMLRGFLLTIGFFLFFCATSFAQPTSKSGPQWPEGEAGVDYNLMDSDGKKQGVWIRVWPNGSLYYSGSFQAGVPEGVFMHYYESGEIMSEIINTDNGKKSQAKHFREDGSLQAEGIYVRTKKLNAELEPIRQKLGTWKFYDKTGQLRLFENYSNGKLHGATQTTGTNGLIIESGSYSNGERDGVWKTFSETGSLLSEMGYSEGLFDGLVPCQLCRQACPAQLACTKEVSSTDFGKHSLKTAK